MGGQVTTTSPTGKVVIADRSPHFRETLRRVLLQNTDAEVIGEAGSFREALRLVREKGARVVLLAVDLAMNQPATRLRRIAESLPELRVIVLLDDDTPGYRQAIRERWGYTCVAKENAESELLPALSAPPRQRLSRA